jgi:hypothetical protein
LLRLTAEAIASHGCWMASATEYVASLNPVESTASCPESMSSALG